MPIYYNTGLESQVTRDSKLYDAESAEAASVRQFCENDLSQAGGTLGSAEGTLVCSVTTHLHTPPTKHTSKSSESTQRQLINQAVTKYRRKKRPVDISPIRSLAPGDPITFDRMMRFRPDRAWLRLKRHEKKAIETRTLLMNPDWHACPFTQRLSHAWIKQLVGAKEAPTKKHSDELRRRMAEIVGHELPLTFQFEVDPENGLLHVHGIVAFPVSGDLGELVDGFLKVLEKAGGYKGHEQGHLDVLRDHGWQDYMVKDCARAAELLGTDKLDYTSRSLKDIAQAEHAADLARRIEAKAMRSSEIAKDDSGGSPARSDAAALSGTPDDSQRPSMAVSEDFYSQT